VPLTPRSSVHAVKLPSITVVTACLNAGPALEHALESVRSQDYPGLEHLVVDGGSPDGTLDILRAAEGVSFISEPDCGRADAVNKGIARSSGEVIGFLNADDRYEPGALRVVGEAFAEHPGAAWVTGECRIVDGDGREIRRAVKGYKNFLLHRFSYPLYLTHNFVSDPATFARREALEEAGPLDPAYRISHDYDLWLRIARRHQPLVLRRELSSFAMAAGSMGMEDFDLQFREHAHAARRRGEGHRAAVAANAVISRAIVATYHLLRAVRRARRRAS
jgi:glycosyltransferase involved in cell wall biosynthesis